MFVSSNRKRDLNFLSCASEMYFSAEKTGICTKEPRVSLQLNRMSGKYLKIYPYQQNVYITRTGWYVYLNMGVFVYICMSERTDWLSECSLDITISQRCPVPRTQRGYLNVTNSIRHTHRNITKWMSSQNHPLTEISNHHEPNEIISMSRTEYVLWMWRTQQAMYLPRTLCRLNITNSQRYQTITNPVNHLNVTISTRHLNIMNTYVDMGLMWDSQWIWESNVTISTRHLNITNTHVNMWLIWDSQ